jgi:mRNA-degrading endonuclease RelE of RelBE toxin-antitoxin system
MEPAEWRLELARLAQRDLRRLSLEMRGRIMRALDGLTTLPRRGDIKKLEGSENHYRLRVGE